MTDITERLQKLGFSPASTLKTQMKNNLPLEKVVGGRKIYNNQGEVIIKENLYPYGTKYGKMLIELQDQENEIIKFAKNTGTTEFSHNKIYIDTETTGLNGGTGTFPFVIGYGYFDLEGFRTVQLLLENPANEMAQLIELSNALQNYNTTVTFNGKSFDLPLIKTRYLINKLDNPLINYSHIDLLHISRKIWKMRLADRSLKELESKIIYFTRESNDVPGWMIPQIYFDYLRSNDGNQLKHILYHNEVDVVSMAVLYQIISQMLNLTKIQVNMEALDLYSLAKMYSKIGEKQKSLLLYKKCLILEGFSIDITCEIHNSVAEIHKQQSQFQSALPHWIFSAEHGNYLACIELAKYFEHHDLDPKEAGKWTKLAIRLINESSLSKYMKNSVLNKIMIRNNRLTRRMNNV